MRVGFDVSPLFRPHPRGIVRLTDETVRALEARGTLEVVRLEPPAGRDLRAWRQRDLPREVAARGLFGVHSFVSAFPWRGPGKRVHTLHELPWKHGVHENADLRHRFWASLGTRRADATVTGTERAARDLGRPLAAEGGRVHVVPWGVGDAFRDEPEPGSVDEVALARYRRSESAFALCLGAVRAKKNLASVIDGLARLVARGAPELALLVSGPDTPQLRRDLGRVARLGLSRWVSTPGEIEEPDLPAVLRLATVVPVLSRSEGFALPVLEALACGTPVIVPRGSAQAEVAGPAGIAVDPDDADSVADGLERALRERVELRYRLADRAREFPWTRTAAALESIWEGLA